VDRPPAEMSGVAGRSVLAVFAHPDDESLACGGTLARLADLGARVVLMCASHGERGGVSGPVEDEELGRTRALELQEAAALLGVHDLFILNHPDGDLRWADVSEFQAEIVAAIKRFRPAAVITFGEDGLYWHLDHVGVHERTTAAVDSLGAAAPPLYYVTMPPDIMRPIVDAAAARGWTPPEKGFWSLTPDAFGLGAEPPTIVLDVKDWAARKLSALRCHRSQTSPDDPISQIDEQQARRWFGIEHFHRAPTPTAGEPVLELLESYAS
jgi:N-acetyl-1-D-myo-inositol-2-amino-2-deoxy-alpha-D-glucopyranoside deacetylase